jgi:hypothetical protein
MPPKAQQNWVGIIIVSLYSLNWFPFQCIERVASIGTYGILQAYPPTRVEWPVHYILDEV